MKIFIFKIPRDKKKYINSSTSVLKNCHYNSKYGRNEFDIYTPPANTKILSSIIWVHGGGYIGGDKVEEEDYALKLSKLGYQVFVMNYELLPKSRYPQPVQQVCDFFAHLLKNSDVYNVDYENIFIAGNSAGAQIASQFVVVQNNRDYSKKIGVDVDFLPVKFRGALLFCGIYDLIELAEESASKIVRFFTKHMGTMFFRDRNWLQNDRAKYTKLSELTLEEFPPVFITDGNTFSFEQQAKELVNKLKNNQIPVKTRFFDKNNVTVNHEFQFELDSEEAILVFEDVVEFLHSNRKVQ
ncbi:alpha/beta hydrolase [Lactococcus garvieae]|uniref:alpha/beta hydrolase n=1 Tax=Lactococcus garvieae TaxID=1363 RepID=UPI0022E7091C|nr:alpha/beta hydrolase [Lactococcus garvieae]